MTEEWVIRIQGLEPSGPTSGRATDVCDLRAAVSEMIEQVAFHSNLNSYGDDYSVKVEVK